MRLRSHSWLLALGISGLLASSAGAAPALRPGFVGQITDFSGGAWVTHAGARAAAERYQALYPGDVVEVRGGGTATIAMADGYGGDVVLDAQHSPLRITAVSGPVDLAAFRR